MILVGSHYHHRLYCKTNLKMNLREIESSPTTAPLSLRRLNMNYGNAIKANTCSAHHGDNRQKHLAQQRQQRFQDQRTRTDTLINKSIKHDGVIAADEIHNDDVIVSRNKTPTRNTSVRKKMNEAALSHAMSAPGRNQRKQHENEAFVQVCQDSSSLPRYGSRSLSAFRLARVQLNQSHERQEVSLAKQLNVASSSSTAHTAQTSDDEISSEGSLIETMMGGYETKDEQLHKELESVKKEMADEIETNRSTIQALMLSHTRYKNELKSVTEENKRAQDEVQAQKEVINQLNDNLLSTKKSLVSKETTVLNLQKQIFNEKEALSKKIKSQESKMKELTASYSKLQFEFNKRTFVTTKGDISKESELEKEVERLMDEVKIKSAENSALRVDLEHLKEELNSKVKAERGPRCEKQSLLERLVCEKDNQIKKLGSDLSVALSVSLKLQSKVDEILEAKVHLEKILGEKDSEAEEMRANISNITRKCSLSEEYLHQKDSEISFLHNQLKESKEFIADKDAEIDKVLKDCKKSIEDKDGVIKCIKEHVQLNLFPHLETQLQEKKLENENNLKEISTLRTNTKRLEAELEDCKEFYAKKLSEQQTPSLEPTRQMERNLRTKEVELELLRIELNRSKAQCSKLKSAVEPMSAEIEELKAWKKKAKNEMHNQQNNHKNFVEDKIECIQALEQRLQANEYEATMRYEVELNKWKAEVECLKSDVEVKDVEILRIKADMDEIVNEMNSLSNWTEEAKINLQAKEREVMVLEIAARRNLDFENEAERQRAKYQKAKKSLNNMEKVLQAIEKERRGKR